MCINNDANINTSLFTNKEALKHTHTYIYTHKQLFICTQILQLFLCHSGGLICTHSNISTPSLHPLNNICFFNASCTMVCIRTDKLLSNSFFVKAPLRARPILTSSCQTLHSTSHGLYDLHSTFTDRSQHK